MTNAYLNQYRTDGFASTFARVNYNLKDRYFFQATARVDLDRHGLGPTTGLASSFRRCRLGHQR